MTINRGPTEALFELISDLFLSGSSTANKIGLTTGRIQVFGKQIIALSGDGLKLAGIAINYFVARNAAIAQNPQNSQKENRKKQTVRIEYIETSSSSIESSSSEEEFIPEPPRTRSRRRKKSKN